MASSSNTGGPFDIMMPNASTFTASSSGTKHLPFDIFINHCGKDTKHTVATKLYNSLNSTGLKVFLDKDELKYGDLLPKALEEAMASASIYIAIFSEHYAQSPWCLTELEYMVKSCKTIIPIFYHVDPSDLRWAVGGKLKYAAAFLEHEEKARYAPDVLKRWKEALQQVSLCIGGIINNIDDEQRVVKNVVNRVMKEMKKERLHVAEHPVGLDEAVTNFDTFQSAGSSNFIVIWGMGGSGKTTLAKEIFNRRSSNMDRSSFVCNVQEAAAKGQLLEKQKTVIKDLSDKEHNDNLRFDNLDEGKQILENLLSRSMSVHIVLDNVDHKDQLDALLPPKKSLGGRSLIIITTRDSDVVRQWGISAIYPMKPLNATHAKQLFCWHAFLKNSPPSEFKDLVEMFVNACGGLPLSLKVLGGQLCGKSDMDYWQDTLKKYSQIPHTDIKKRLKISYDALEKEEQVMFLDAACLFIGQRKTAAIAAWGAEFYGTLGWDSLFNKCLVEEDENGLIRVHDQLSDMGRDIANRQSPYRLWSPQQVIEIPPQQEAIRVRGMANAVSDNCKGKIIINTSEGRRSLVPLGLKFFLGNGGFINQATSKELIWFQCQGFDHKNVPSGLSLKNLRILELVNADSLECLSVYEAEVLSVREVVQLFQECRRLPEFPWWSIGFLYVLIKSFMESFWHSIKLSGHSTKLSGLPEEFCNLQKLEHLEVYWSRKLSSLPSNFGKLTNLKHLSLNGCRELKELPSSFKKFTLLEYLNLCNCSKLIIKSELHVLENMSRLRYLNLTGCRKLEELRLPKVASLTELYLRGTSLKELPANISQLTKLIELQIGSESLTALPTSFGNLPSLTNLRIEGCYYLFFLPTSFRNLSSLTKLEIQECHNLKLLPTSFENLSSLIDLKIQTCENLEFWPTSDLETLPVSPGKLSSLTTFEIRGCKKLDALPDSLEHLSFLTDLYIDGSGLKCLPKSLFHLKMLRIYSSPISKLSFKPGCMVKEIHLRDTKVSKISISGDCCPFLETLFLEHNNDLKELEILPSTLKTIEVASCDVLHDIRGVRVLRKLQHLLIYYCRELEGLPCFAELVSLQTFALTVSKVKKIEGLESITSLQMLTIYDCSELDGLQYTGEVTYLELAKCPKLEKIIISPQKLKVTDRPQLKARPIDIPKISSLNCYVLQKCHTLKKIKGLENIRSVEALHIYDCPELYGLSSLSKLTSLKEFVLYGCRKLEKVKGLENIQSLEKLTIYGCPELDGLPDLEGLTSLEEFKLQIFHKLEEIEGLENIRSLKKLRIYDCPQLHGLPNLPGLICHKVEPFISKMQKWPREVITCTRAMCDVGSLKNFFKKVPNVSFEELLRRRESDERESDESLWVRRPQRSAKANAILICFIIDTVFPDLHYLRINSLYESSSEEGDFDSFVCKVGKGKWVWMGLFTEASEWFRLAEFRISAYTCDDGEVVEVEVEAAWSVMGKEGSIVEAFRDLWKSSCQ